MSAGHLNVPSATESQGNSFTGRARSGSTRSQRSQHSEHSQHSQRPNSITARPEIPLDYGRRPTIRIRGFSGLQQQAAADNGSSATEKQTGGGVTRKRSTSAPQRYSDPPAPRLTTNQSPMPDVAEEIISPTSGDVRDAIQPAPAVEPASFLTRATSWQPRRRAQTNVEQTDFGGGDNHNDYETNLVDFLDTIDPEVSTLNTLNNVQNTLFIPDLGRYLNRRPTYNITRPQADLEEQYSSDGDLEEGKKIEGRLTAQRLESTATLNTLNSRVNDKYYAVLPHGVSVAGWSEEEKLELNDYVRHMLHSRRNKFKRGMKGFGQYVRKPLGAFVTIYATLITLFGLAWVLFLIGWINVGGRQHYLINIIDNVLVALFAIMGDGLAPFRAVDTYHMIFIAHYHHLTWRLRKEKALPKLADQNDLPPLPSADEAADPKFMEDKELSVLSPEQQKKLAHHQRKFAKSHTYYKPHETNTHNAFPLRYLVAIVVLCDCHSLLQIALGTCTWAIYYKRRPFALTTVILCFSITCNIAAGVVIMIGDRKTRKKDVLERMERQELTRSAIKKVERRKERESMDILRETGMSVDIRREDLAGVPDTGMKSTKEMLVHDQLREEERLRDENVAAEAAPTAGGGYPPVVSSAKS